MMQAPCFRAVYDRGNAATQREVQETALAPDMGFNLWWDLTLSLQPCARLPDVAVLFMPREGRSIRKVCVATWSYRNTNSNCLCA